MGIFFLKYRDTLPVLQVVLHDPAPAGSLPNVLGPVHDLTGSFQYNLHIWLVDGTKLVRTMSKVGVDSAGTLEYAWVTTDWGAASSADSEGSYQVGGLVVGPSLPLTPGTREHWMEYEVIGPADARMTFPNGGYDSLRIYTDIGQS